MSPDPPTAAEMAEHIMEERAEVQQQVEAPTPVEDTTAAQHATPEPPPPVDYAWRAP